MSIFALYYHHKFLPSISIQQIVAKGEARRNFDRSQSKAGGGGGGGGSGGMVPSAGAAAPSGVPKSPARRAAGANVDKPLY